MSSRTDARNPDDTPRCFKTDGLLERSSDCITIGLLDHLGHGNLGDEVTFSTVMRNISIRRPYATFVGLSLNPQDTLSRHGVPAFAIRSDSKQPRNPSVQRRSISNRKAAVKRYLAKIPIILSVTRMLRAILIQYPRVIALELLFLLESLRVVRTLDLLVVCGGGQLLDSWGGAWSFPYTIFKWVALAKLCGIPCYVINVGAGPIQHRLSRVLIRHTLSMGDYISFRDNESQALTREIGFEGRSDVRPDNVYSFVIGDSFTPRYRTLDRPRIVGICPMIYCDPRVYWEKNQDIYGSLITTLADFAFWLTERGCRLSLFSTDTRIDLPAIADVRNALLGGGHFSGIDLSLISEPQVRTAEDLLGAISAVDYIVTCRFHGVIFSHLMNKPVIALSHHSKVATLMSDLGLSDFCHDISACDSRLLATTFQRVQESEGAIKSIMAKKAEEYKVKLAEQFDELFGSASV